MENTEKQKYFVLDHGFVEVRNVFLSEDDIVQIARLTTGKNKSKLQPTKELIRYLLLHEHASPFGFPEIVLNVKAPLFVMRQWVRDLV
jgi:thymidylate synthase (FAD)